MSYVFYSMQKKLASLASYVCILLKMFNVFGFCGLEVSMKIL